MMPFVCPVCLGAGQVCCGSFIIVSCYTCGGKGLIWGPPTTGLPVRSAR